MKPNFINKINNFFFFFFISLLIIASIMMSSCILAPINYPPINSNDSNFSNVTPTDPIDDIIVVPPNIPPDINDSNSSTEPDDSQIYTMVRDVEIGNGSITARNTIHYFNERIYVVYARNDRFPNSPYPNNHEDTYIRYYDIKTDTVSDEYLVGFGHGNTHGKPTMIVDDKGYIHVFYGSHCDKSQYSVSANPEDITKWIDKTHTLPDTYGYTYSRAVFGDGPIYVFFRSRCHGGTSLRQGNFAFIKSDDYGNTWSEQIEFADASTQRPIAIYPGMVRYVQDTIHLTWYIKCESGDLADCYGPGTRETRHNAYYAKSKDGGKTWLNAGETYSTSKINITEMDEHYLVFFTANRTKVSAHPANSSFIRYRTSDLPRLDISTSGVPYVGIRVSPPIQDGITHTYDRVEWEPKVFYWDGEWKLIPGKYNSYSPFIISDEEIYFLGSTIYRYDGEKLVHKSAGISLSSYIVSNTDTRHRGIPNVLASRGGIIRIVNVVFD
jgi:hypothetical protein